ncbi:MAG: polysaccharide pyruvyl transferase family protein [Pseudonocardia sp.]
MRILVTGWASFWHGEATAGDVSSMRRVHESLVGAGMDSELAWSPGYLPDERGLDDADPARYSHLVFVCGPVHGAQVAQLHRRYPDCRRIAVGVSVIDPRDPAVTGFHRVLARDSIETSATRPDLSTAARTQDTPVIGVILAPGQPEYGGRGVHRVVHQGLADWLTGLDCARLALDTRLDTRDWRHCATPDQFSPVLARLDAVVSTRLHGLVFGLRAGVPVLAVDPVSGGGKVTAQARALGWPALVAAEEVGSEFLDRWWRWCLSSEGRAHATRRGVPDARPLLEELLGELRAGVPA